MRPGALPVSELILLDLIAPPVLAGLFWLKARGRSSAVQGGEVTSRTRQRQSTEFRAVLVMSYLLAFGVTIYAWLT